MWLFILQKRNEKTFCRVKSRIILCVECYGAWLGAIFIFAFCESWKSRRSSLFSRDANKESLLWKLNGAQKLIEPEDTILSKSSKDIFYYNYYNILKMPFSWQEWIFGLLLDEKARPLAGTRSAHKNAKLFPPKNCETAKKNYIHTWKQKIVIFLRFRELFYIEIMCRFPHYMREFVSNFSRKFNSHSSKMNFLMTKENKFWCFSLLG